MSAEESLECKGLTNGTWTNFGDHVLISTAGVRASENPFQAQSWVETQCLAAQRGVTFLHRTVIPARPSLPGALSIK
jgi:hypothetical protein